jgi:predicted nucleotidyltransferase
MILKPQDVLILLKLVALGREPWTYQRLAVELSISQSEAHAGVRRAAAAKLMSDATAAGGRPVLAALAEFLIHGVRYAYPLERGGLTAGIPTSYAAPPLNKVIVQPNEPPPVWPYAQGTVRGYSLEPLYPSVPAAAARDASLYELLALVDAIRDGRARERDLAARELSARLGGEEAAPRPDKLRISHAKLEALCRKYGIAKLSVFGSASRNQLKPESDVDLMVEFLPESRASLFDIAALKEELSAALGGRRVDIATPEILRNPFRRKSIVPDLKPIYVTGGP